MAYQLFTDRVEDWSKKYHGTKFHAVLCDPPYGLKFMGKDWDVMSAKEWGEALLPHLYPGALVLMFGGTRTWHKLATGMEEAGFEMWDTLMWLYGQGFPKAQDIGKMVAARTGETPILTYANPADRPYTHTTGETSTGWQSPVRPDKQVFANPWQGFKTTALKPAWEPILAFKVPTKERYADVALTYGSGALNIGDCLIPLVPGVDDSQLRTMHRSAKSEDNGWGMNQNASDTPQVVRPEGRYPANVILDEQAAVQLDEQTGVLTSGKPGIMRKCVNDSAAYGAESRKPGTEMTGFGDSGGASRFFYCSKSSTSERNIGLVDQKNTHPTVKPIALIQYLATLLLPPSSVTGRLLVPFAGSGSEMVGALKAGWSEVVGIEEKAEHVAIAEARLAHATAA